MNIERVYLSTSNWLYYNLDTQLAYYFNSKLFSFIILTIYVSQYFLLMHIIVICNLRMMIVLYNGVQRITIPFDI